MGKYDPLKIGAAAGTITGGLIMGFMQGIINSTGNAVDGYIDGMTFLGNGCLFDPSKKLVSDETLTKLKDIKKVMNQLDDVEKLIKRIARLLAAYYTGDYSLINGVDGPLISDPEGLAHLGDDEYDQIKSYIALKQLEITTWEFTLTLHNVVNDAVKDVDESGLDGKTKEQYELFKTQSEAAKKEIQKSFDLWASLQREQAKSVLEAICGYLQNLDGTIKDEIENFECKFKMSEEKLRQKEEELRGRIEEDD